MPPLVQPVVTALPTHQPVIQVEGGGGRLALRPWTRGDGAQLKAAFKDQQIRHWYLHEFANMAEARDWVEHSVRRWRKRRGASWAVVDRRRPDIVLGQIGFRSLYLADGLAELSCWVMPKARGRGVATEATRLLSTWGFDTLRMERLEIIHSVQNAPPCRVALHAGFQVEGVKRRLQKHADGFHDMCMHSRISTDDGEPILSEPPPSSAAALSAATEPPDARPARRLRRLPRVGRRRAFARRRSRARAAAAASTS